MIEVTYLGAYLGVTAVLMLWNIQVMLYGTVRTGDKLSGGVWFIALLGMVAWPISYPIMILMFFAMRRRNDTSY